MFCLAIKKMYLLSERLIRTFIDEPFFFHPRVDTGFPLRVRSVPLVFSSKEIA
jgi:hypothetical protein